MRPVSKNPWPQANGEVKSYKPHTIAKPDLETNIDCFCSYCEVFSSDLEVEHIVSQNQDPSKAYDWDNFLLACGRCNGRDNKSNKSVDLTTIHFPHKNNTILSFVYKEGGYVAVNTTLTGASLIHARNLLDLVGLDKIPGNLKYSRLNPNDTRWKHRRITWEWAMKYLPEYVNGNLTAQQIVDFAMQKGFFSVWFNVFENYPLVRKLLIENFIGTDPNCFDSSNGYNPIPRNPQNTSDSI